MDENGSRLAEYGDILILVKNRIHLEEYETKLSRAKIPFSGSWRGGLLRAMEVRDIISMLRFLNDKTLNVDLATVLKSPMFMVSDPALLHLAKLETNSEFWWDRINCEEYDGEAFPILHEIRIKIINRDINASILDNNNNNNNNNIHIQ